MHHFKVFIPHNSNYASGIITGEYYAHSILLHQCDLKRSEYWFGFGYNRLQFSVSVLKIITTSTCSLHFNCI